MGKVVYADLHKRPSESLITGNKECRPVVVTNKDVVLQDGTCDVANEMAYIISRRKLLGSQVLQRALLILILSVVVYVADQQERFRAAYETVRNHLKAAAVKRKAYYDANVRARHFQEGDRVWYFYPRQYTRRSKKWSFAYVGPYTVLKKISDLTYQIQKSRKVKPIIVHVDKLKRCTEPTAAEVGGEVKTVWTCRICD